MQNGLRLNLNKTEFLTTDPHEIGTITISGNEMLGTERFKYLGSTLSANGELRYEIASCINATWMKWPSTTGVLCDRRINECHKSKIYRNVDNPVTLYGFECWPTIKDNERRFAVIRGFAEDIRVRYGVAPIVEKLRERRLRSYGHVIRANENSLAKIRLKIEVDGKRPKGRSK